MHTKSKYSIADQKRGNLIRYYRRQHGMTQADLAERLDVSVNAVYEWEKGGKPSLKHWHALCRELSLPPELLDMDLTNPVSAQNVQIAFLRQLDLPSDVQQKVEEAFALYYGDEEPLPAVSKPLQSVIK